MINENQHIDEVILMSYLLGELSSTEQAQVEAWLNASAKNQQQLDALETIWLESGKLAPAPIPVDVDSAWKKLSQKIDFEESKPQEHEKQTFSFLQNNLLRIAAILFVFVGVYQVFDMLNKPKELTLSAQEEVVKDSLPDGSQIAINKNSQLIYSENFGKKQRRVKLKGEAFFNVKPEKTKPFVIEAGFAQVKVLGTSFNVDSKSAEQVTVSVRTGLVQLFRIAENGDTLSVMLTAGETGKLNANAPKPEKIDQAKSDLFWLDNRLVFEETELEEVFRLLEKHFQVNIEVSNDSINLCKLSSTFTNENIDNILQVIAESFELELQQDSTSYRLTGKGCD